MRIIIYSTMQGFSWGGSEELWYDFTKVLLSNTENKILLCLHYWENLDHRVTELAKNQNVKLVLRHQSSRYKSILSRLLKRRRNSAFDKINQFKGDAILISQANTYDFVHNDRLKRLIANFDGPCFIVNQFDKDYGGIDKYTREQWKHHIKYFTKILFVANRNRQVLERRLAIHLDKAQLINNPVNLADKSSLPFPDIRNGIKIAHIARLDCAFKGQDILIQTVHQYPELKELGFTITLYGKGPDHDQIRELIEFYNLSDIISIGGHMSDIKSIWMNNHVLILPSIAEGTPLSLVEAMICGRPAIFTDVGGNSELIKHGITGYICPAPSPEYLKDALMEMANNRGNLSNMGNLAHHDAILRYRDRAGETLLKIVRDALL